MHFDWNPYPRTHDPLRGCHYKIFQDGGRHLGFRHLGFDGTGNSTIRSADPENHILEPNMKWIGSVADIWPGSWNGGHLGRHLEFKCSRLTKVHPADSETGPHGLSKTISENVPLGCRTIIIIVRLMNYCHAILAIILLSPSVSAIVHSVGISGGNDLKSFDLKSCFKIIYWSLILI